MSPDKTKELISVYPELFSDLCHQTCMHLFGFECNDGWFDLLKDLITEIKLICNSEEYVAALSLDDKPSQLKVSQVKEKYGTLHFYTSYSNNAIDAAIERAEKRSLVTCEFCGKEGKLKETGHRWYQTLCEECFCKYKSQ